MATTQAKIDKWLKNAEGRGMNPDGMYGYQCKDVIDDYCLALFGDWVNTVRPGDAHQVFKNANPNYFIKIENKPNSPNLIPKKGDIICWPKGVGDKYGHIAVVVSADVNGVTVIQQDGLQNTKPAHKIWRSYWRMGVVTQGWLRPRLKPVVTTKEETKTEVIPFSSTTTEDPTVPLGEERLVQAGVDGTRTIVYTVTYTDGKETSRKVKSDTTKQPIQQIVAVGTYVEPEPLPEPPVVIPPIPTPDWLKSLLQWLKELIIKMFKGDKK